MRLEGLLGLRKRWGRGDVVCWICFFFPCVRGREIVV